MHPVGTDSVLLGVWADVSDAQRILDIGTGTGVIALMLAQRTTDKTQIRAVEIHAATAACAAANFKASPWHHRLDIQHAAVQNFAQQPDYQFDVIVSNPPFFSETVVAPDATRRLGRSTDSLLPGDLLYAVQQLLAPNGRYCVVLPPKEGQRWCELAAVNGLYCTRRTLVFSRMAKPVERWLLQFERSPYSFQQDNLLIYNENAGHSPEFEQMTRDFYRKL